MTVWPVGLYSGLSTGMRRNKNINFTAVDVDEQDSTLKYLSYYGKVIALPA